MAVVTSFSTETENVGTAYISVNSLHNADDAFPPSRGWVVRLHVEITAGSASTVTIALYEEITGLILDTIEFSSSPGGKTLRAWYEASDPSAIGYKVKTDDGSGNSTVLVTVWYEADSLPTPVLDIQPWDQVTVRYAPQNVWDSGASGSVESSVDPTCHVKRISDGLYLQADHSWGSSSGIGTFAMSWVSDGAFQGFYESDAFYPASRDREAGRAGYLVSVISSSGRQLQMIRIVPTESPWEAEMTEFRDAGTFGEGAFLTLALRQRNSLWVPDAWSSAGQATHGYMYVYESQTALDADSSPYSGAYARYEVTLTYDGSDRLTNYKAKDA